MKSIPVLCAILVYSGCASLEPEKTCDPPCQEWEECIDGICIPQSTCCHNAPPGENWAVLSGVILDITGRPISASICATGISPGQDPGPCQESGADGSFQTDCLDYFGSVFTVDDPERDGPGGNYFPTVTAPKKSDGDVLACIYNDVFFALPNSLVAHLDANTSVDSVNYGVVIGIIADQEDNLVAGALIKKGDGAELVEVIYPDATFTTFDGTATSASGIFVLPHTNFTGGTTEIVAEKDGMTFGVEEAATKTGFCTMIFIRSY